MVLQTQWNSKHNEDRGENTPFTINSFYYEMIQSGYLGKHIFQYFIEQQRTQNAFVFLEKRNQD